MCRTAGPPQYLFAECVEASRCSLVRGFVEPAEGPGPSQFLLAERVEAPGPPRYLLAECVEAPGPRQYVLAECVEAPGPLQYPFAECVEAPCSVVPMARSVGVFVRPLVIDDGFVVFVFDLGFKVRVVFSFECRWSGVEWRV